MANTIASWQFRAIGDELKFKQQFAIQFLASWTAVHYNDYCARGLELAPPVEDAEFLADQAWEHWHNTLYPTPNKQ